MALGDGIGNMSFDKIEWYFNQLGVAFDNTLVMLFTKIKLPTAPILVKVKLPTSAIMTKIAPPTAPIYTRVP